MGVLKYPTMKVLHVIRRLLILYLVMMVRAYQVMLSPLLIGSCKFYPTCSEYCIQAVREWGIVRGGWLGVRRLLRCHPFGPGGLDPVPPKSMKSL